MMIKILEHDWIYRFFRGLTGANHLNKVIAEEYIQSTSSCSVLDLGCGPADIVQHLQFRSFTGLDNNKRYLVAAARRYPAATFRLSHVEDIDLQEGTFDRVIALGVLHHISDAVALATLFKVQRMLSPGGFFLSYDPCFAKGQHVLAKLVHSMDRGQYVRHDHQLIALAKRIFPTVESYRRDDLCTIPSTTLILKCR